MKNRQPFFYWLYSSIIFSSSLAGKDSAEDRFFTSETERSGKGVSSAMRWTGFI